MRFVTIGNWQTYRNLKSPKKHNLNQVMISRLESGQVSQAVERLFDIFATLDLELVLQPRKESSAEDIADMFL